MSRSKRKPFYKDKGIYNKFYNKTIRRVVKHHLRLKYNKGVIIEFDNFENEDVNIPHPKNIINDWDYSEYKWEYKLEDGLTHLKFTRK